MRELTILSPSEQVAEHLRGELLRGRWSGTMPGVPTLAAELGVDHKAVASAIGLLEKDGLLVGQGTGRPRRIVPQKDHFPPALRVGILAGEPADLRLDYMVELRHELVEAGHQAFYAADTLVGLGMDVKRIARRVDRTEAEAWVVVAGSRVVLEWFAAQERPAFALFGRRRGLPLAGAGPDKRPAIIAATQALTVLGHRRIVLLARARRRLPQPGASEQAFLDALTAAGIDAGPYHLPDWDESIAGFHVRLGSLFRITPPTALIIQEAPLFIAVMQFCALRRLRVPHDLSLVCTDDDPGFNWCQPAVSHIRWDSAPLVRRVVGWAANVSRGNDDRRQTLTRAEFVEGGTIGPVRDRRGGAGVG